VPSAAQAPATAQYAVAAPTPAAQTGPPPPDPATQDFPNVPAPPEVRERPVGARVSGRGRAPAPPSRPSSGEPAPGSDDDSITEIIRPPAQNP
jgi:hypothetical protein